MAKHDIIRITKEIAAIQKGTDLSIAVACRDDDVRKVRALIIGPPDTPYEYGFFEFNVEFGSKYPSEPPTVSARTTNSGTTRFNPNIYAGGRVCLSILGTWQGEQPGEQWSTAQGLESVLWSIQSLMSNTPYENEPGFNVNNESDKKLNQQYCEKIKHETIRIAVIKPLEKMLRIQTDGSVKPIKKATDSSEDWASSDEESSESEDKKPSKRQKTTAKAVTFQPFVDLMKQRFLWYYETYLTTIETEMPQHKDGSLFDMMSFEGKSNEMAGKFDYSSLGRRLVRIKEVLSQEIQDWARDGSKAKERDSVLAYGLEGQLLATKAYLRERDIHNIELGFEKRNPFVWILTYMGKSGTNLEGGIWRIKLSIPPEFPSIQPRAKFETKIFHHRVSKDGVVCYFPERGDEIKYHVASIIQGLEESSPPFDPRMTVHPEATKLFWGSETDKKMYGRKQRRSAQDSVEEVF